MSRRKFSPPWWSIVLVVALSALMITMGVWQIQRAQGKEALTARYLAAATDEPRDLTVGAWAEPGVIARGRAVGRFDAEQQLLLDNQGLDGKPGFHVWTPLLLTYGGRVIVDRGWVPSGGDRSQLPDIPVPEGEVQVTGFWRTLPEPGMRLEVDNCAGEGWPRIVQYPTVDEMRCIYGEYLASGVLMMDRDLPGGFAREWTAAPELSPMKHYGYAAQWFAFTLTLWVIFVVMNLKRKR